MKNLNMFCLTLEPDHYQFIKYSVMWMLEFSAYWAKKFTKGLRYKTWQGILKTGHDYQI